MNRSKKFVFIPFCLIAQAYQAQGIVKYEWKSSIKPIIQLLLDNQQYEVDFPMNNGMMYCSIKLNDLLCEDDKFRINELNNDKYHIEIDMLNDKNIINIHNKGVN